MSTLLDHAVLAANLSIQQRLHRIRALPIVIVYLNNICDSRCQTCEIWKNNDALKIPAQRQMTDELLQELYESLGAWRPRQILISGGEPALHPRFAEVIANFRAIAPKVCVITNGLLLGSCEPAALTKAEEFYISFDAPDSESYRKIRGVDGFDRLTQSLNALHALRRRPKLVARCTLQRDNIRRIADLIETARRLKFDAISFLGADVSSPAFSRDVHGPTDPTAIQPSREDLSAMEAALDSLPFLNTEFIEGGVQKLRQILQYFRALLGDAEFPPVRCNAPWISVVIETSGKIRGCFFQPIIGDFRNINGDAALHFRRNLKVDSDPTCRRCVCSKWLGAGAVGRL